MAELPQSAGEKIKFSLPVIILTLVLAILIGGLITYFVNNATLEKLDALDKKTDARAAKIEKALADTESSLKTAIAEQGKKFDDANKKLADALSDVGTKLDGIAKSYETFVSSQTKTNETHGQDIAKNANDVHAVEIRVKYVEDKLAKLDALEKDVDALKLDTGQLKEQYVALRSDLTAVKTRTDVTEKDLTDLGERTRLFQLRVLAARAREAADAARSADLKTLVSRLEDAGSEK